MSTANLSRILNPKSIVVIGASEKNGRIGETIARNILSNNFKGDFYPINPHYKEIMGFPVLASVNDIPKKTDLIIIAAPINIIPGILETCADKDIGGMVIISAGGKEAGRKGRQIEAEIKKLGEKTGIRLIGPNCVGIINAKMGLNASFMHQLPLIGKTALIAQSGAVCGTLLDLAIRDNVGFSHIVGLGSKVDVDFADMIEYMGSLDEVENIVMYIESISNIRNFMRAARKVSRKKPIIVLKSGRSEAGARAAASHTGAMAGVDTSYDAAFKRAGILRVNDLQVLFDYLEFLSKNSRPKGGRLAIITNAGGPGIMSADTLAKYDLEPACLTDETKEKLDTLMKKQWSRSNPVDVLGDKSPEQYIKVTDICCNAPEVDGVLLIYVPTGMFKSEVLAEPLAQFLKTVKCPVTATWLGGGHVEKSRALFNAAGVATYDTPERAANAFADLYQYGRNIDMLNEIPVQKNKKLEVDQQAAKKIIENSLEVNLNSLNEIEAKKLLNAYGIPVNRTELASTSSQAAQIAEEIGFPVALKICSKDILHKSDSGGVFLNISTPDHVNTAFKQIMKNAKEKFPYADIEGVSVQVMSPLPDYELIFGAKKDEIFGPILLFGTGGVMTEIFKDISMALPPLSHTIAEKVIQETKISRVLKGYRNFKAVELTLLEEILMRLSRLVTDFPEIEELDINPLTVRKGEIMGVDARVLIKKTDVVSPTHLIVSQDDSAWQEA